MYQALGYSSVGSDGFGLGFSIVAGLILITAWIILASSRLVQGGVVERPERVPQLYGYAVCLIALIWALVSTVSIIGGVAPILMIPVCPASRARARSRKDWASASS